MKALKAFFALTAFLILTALTAFSLPSKVYLPVPFLCQAPFGNWAEPWQDACEEASIIMAMHYIKHEPLSSVIGNQEILKLVDFQIKTYGGHYDLTAAQSLKLIKDYYHFDNVEIDNQPTVEKIKDYLAQGKIVIAPMAGRLLGNPYYTPPGPAYHYMLFKGYDERRGEFITNDSGTKRGRNYRYKYAVAFAAIHDFQGGQVILVVKSK